MSKAGELDWTELYRTGKTLEPEAPESKPLKKGKQTGKDVLEDWGKDMTTEIVDGFRAPGIKQPTDEEMFGSLVKSKEEIDTATKTARKDWEDKLVDIYAQWKPATVVKSHNHDLESWGNNKPIMDKGQQEALRKSNKEQIEKG